MKSNQHQHILSLIIAFNVAFLCTFVSTIAQSCLPDGIILSSQAQIDAFQTAYPGCTEILGGIIIEETISGDIINLNGLSQITIFENSLEINTNSALKNLAGLEAVSTIKGRLTIRANRSLISLEGLNNLISIGESLRISSNSALKDISALRTINTVKSDLSIAFNEKLPSLFGLNGITSIGGYLIIGYNNSLANLSGLNALTSIGSNLQIEKNENLKSLNGLEAVTSVGGDLIIDGNPTLSTLQGLNSVRSVGGFLQIVNNHSIENLTGLNAVRNVKGLVQIYNNNSLTSLNGIDSINHETIIDLAILSCPMLSICAVQSVCYYLGIPSNLSSISNNEERCNSREGILNSCNTKGGSNSPPVNKIVFFPNPTSGIVEVKGQGVENAVIKVTDSIGRLVFKKNLVENTIDLSNLASGLYFIALTTDKKNIVAPVCKVEY